MLKKILIAILLVITVFLLFKFGVISEIVNTLNDITSLEISPEQNLEINTNTDYEKPKADEIAEVTQDSIIEDKNSPKLEDLDYKNMSLFEDGFEIVKIKYFTDGDTAVFLVSGKEYKTRFLAIDTPEKDPEKREVEPWGNAASNFTKQKLKDAEKVMLELDPDSDIFDKYDRLLAWVWVDGELLNYLLVDNGFAEVAYLYGDYLYTDYLETAEFKSEIEGLKIWGEIDPDFKYNK